MPKIFNEMDTTNNLRVDSEVWDIFHKYATKVNMDTTYKEQLPFSNEERETQDFYFAIERGKNVDMVKEIIALVEGWEKKKKRYNELKKLQEEEYGVVGWYDWGCKYLGTKWRFGINMNRLSDTELSMNCETAWSAPIPFVQTLSSRFPNLHFLMKSHFEDPGNLITEFEDGECGEVDMSEIAQENLDYIMEMSKDDEELNNIDKTALAEKVKNFIHSDAWNCIVGKEDNYYNFKDFLEWYYDDDDE